MVNMILWLVGGALVGWLAGRGMYNREGAPSTILIGVVGAMIGGFLLNYNTINLFNMQNAFNVTALLASFIGAVVLLTIVKLVWRGSLRSD